MCLFGHLGNSLALWVFATPLLPQNELTIPCVVWIVFFGLVPDMDTLLLKVSPATYFGTGLFAHRGLLHALPGLVVPAGLFYFIEAEARTHATCWALLFLAFSLHIMLDALTYSERPAMKPGAPLLSFSLPYLGRIRWLSYVVLAQNLIFIVALPFFHSIGWMAAVGWAAFLVVCEWRYISRSVYTGDKVAWTLNEARSMPKWLVMTIARALRPFEGHFKAKYQEITNG